MDLKKDVGTEEMEVFVAKGRVKVPDDSAERMAENAEEVVSRQLFKD